MSTLEKDILKKLAKRYNSKRVRVVLPDLPKPILGLSGDDCEQWNKQVTNRMVNAIWALAKDRKADPVELAKVSDLILEVVPPESRGREPNDDYPVFMLVALEMHKRKSQQKACELAGVSVPTFRKMKANNSVGWKIAQHIAGKLPENDIREMAKEPPLK